MTETTATGQDPHSEGESPPPFDPDEELMADLEGSSQAVAAYRREADVLRTSRATR